MSDVWERSVHWGELGAEQRKAVLRRRIRMLEIALAYVEYDNALGLHQQIMEDEMEKRKDQLAKEKSDGED